MPYWGHCCLQLRVWNLYLFFAVLWLISVRLDQTGSTFLFTSVTPMSPRLLGSFRRSKSFTFAPMALPKFRAFFRCWLPPVFDPARADVSVEPAGLTVLLAGRKFSFGCSAALQFSNMLWSTKEQDNKMVFRQSEALGIFTEFKLPFKGELCLQ